MMHPSYARLVDDPNLVVLGFAMLTCGFGAYATSVLGRQALASVGLRARLPWMILAILAATASIYADSFTAILIARGDVPSGFDPAALVFAFVVGYLLVAIAASLTLVSRSAWTAGSGGAVAGVAIATIHQVGMRALTVGGTVTWNTPLTALSVAFGIVFATLSAVSWMRSRSRSPLLPITLFAVAIFGSHLIAIAAVTVAHDPRVPLIGEAISNASLTPLVGAVAALVMLLTLIAQDMNRRSRRRSDSERQQLEQLAELAVEGLVMCERSRIVWINRSLEDMVPGIRSSRIGSRIESLLTIQSLADLPHDREIDVRLRTGDQAADGLVPVRVITRSVMMGDRPHVVVAIRDQRERLRAEAEMKRLADCDALTGLANRGCFNRVLQKKFASTASSSGSPGTAATSTFALLSLDLDRFKSVNDTFGHAAGDAVLMEVAARLTTLVREGDLVARLGGDEFAILASTGRDASGAGALADRVIETIAQPFSIDGVIHQIGVSIGIAHAMHDGDDPESLTSSADLALYRAKADGRGVHCEFEVAMRTRMQERHGLEQSLREAIARGQLRLHFQPQVDARTGTFCGAEALIRWMHPARGLVPPSDFIAIAEETNLILPIGEWVLHAACTEAARWPEPMIVAVNLSPIQFRDATLVDTVALALERAGLPGRRLELEITENVLIEDTAHVKTVLDALKALGIRLSLDDFGTGYSSLGQLHRFPFDKIKVDRAFVRGLPADAGSVAIVRAIVALGAGLGMQTTAEGVEDEAQRGFVTEAGCDQIQGFFFGRPVAADALPDAFRLPSSVGERAARPASDDAIGIGIVALTA